jgi:hypothetical protein
VSTDPNDARSSVARFRHSSRPLREFNVACARTMLWFEVRARRFDLRPVRFLRARTPRHVRKCNRHIVDASVKYLAELRQRTGFRHQLIAVACSVDHAKQV